MKKTSAQWHEMLETKYKGSYVMDPDGWVERTMIIHSTKNRS